MKLWKFTAWIPRGIALLAFVLLATRLARVVPVNADGNRVFELRVYHTVPGKVPALESRFRDITSKLLAKHDLNVVGYWVPDDPSSQDTFIFMLAHSSREEAKKHWDELRVDPAFQEMAKSELTEKLVEKVDVTYMRPTDFSAMK